MPIFRRPVTPVRPCASSLAPPILRDGGSPSLRAAVASLALLVLVAVGALPAAAGTFLVWSGDASPDQVTAWVDRASGNEAWTVTVAGPESSLVKRELAQGRLARPLLHPRDVVDLALLAKTLRGDWILQPGKNAILVSASRLQTASLPLTGDAKSDAQALREAVQGMNRQEAKAGQLEALASRWIDLGQGGLALETLFQAQEKEPNRVMTQALLVDAYRAKGELKEARRFLRMAMKLHPDEPRLLRSAGELELAQSRPREALAFFTRAASDGNATTILYRRIGEAFLALGRDRQAEEAFRLAGNESGSARQHARLLAKRGEYRDAAEAAARALEEDPGDAEMRFLLARSLSEGSRYAQAVRDRARALTDAAEADSSARPVPFLMLQSALRDQIADTINAIRRFQSNGEDRPLLYAAAQESVIAADRLRSVLRGRPEWHEERTTGKQRILALTLWSQGAYDLMKALEAKSPDRLNEPGEILHDALRQLDDVNRGGSRLTTR